MRELNIKETEVISAGGVGGVIASTIPGIIVGKIVDKSWEAWTNSDQYKANMKKIDNSPYAQYMKGNVGRTWGNGGGSYGGGGVSWGSGGGSKKNDLLMCMF